MIEKKIEQEKVDNLISNFGSENLKKNLQTIREIKNNIDEIINLVKNNNNQKPNPVVEFKNSDNQKKGIKISDGICDACNMLK